jgi:hypothetical protein
MFTARLWAWAFAHRWATMYFFTKYIYWILDHYNTHLELIDTIPMGLTGVASERPAPTFTNEISEDLLYFAAAVNFSNADVRVRIRSISPQYEWMADDASTPIDTPVNAIAGVFSQSMPVLPLVQPFFVKKQGRLQMQFTNAATSPVTGGLWTWRALRLTNPKSGNGWDYSLGFGN